MVPPINATEALERAKEMSEILGQTYGALQDELLTPLVTRVFNLMKEKGLIP